MIWSGTQTYTVIEQKEKNVQSIRTSADFQRIASTYLNQVLDEQNFETGQVILIDDGDIDSCAAHLEFNAVLSATEVSDNTVKITLNYVEKPRLDKCSPSYSRPFYFYYLNTRKLVVFEEKII